MDMKLFQDFEKKSKKQFYDKEGIVSKIDRFFKSAQEIIECVERAKSAEDITKAVNHCKTCSSSVLDKVLDPGATGNGPFDLGDHVQDDTFKPMRENIINHIIDVANITGTLLEKIESLADDYVNAKPGIDKTINGLKRDIRELKWDSNEIKRKYESEMKMLKIEFK